MCERSCELAHEVDATLWHSVVAAGCEIQRAWTFHFAPLRDTICVHVLLAIKLSESRS